MRMSQFILTLAAASLLVTGCARQRAPANEALQSIEKSLAAVHDDAQKYAPDGLKGVESQLDRLKTSFDAKQYDNVLAGTPQLEKAVDSLKSAVAASKAQATARLAAAKTEWEGLKADVPQMVDTIQARVDKLSGRKVLPWGIDRKEFANAKASFESMKSSWAAAAANAKAGDTLEATSKAKEAKGVGEQLMDQLKIKQS